MNYGSVTMIACYPCIGDPYLYMFAIGEVGASMIAERRRGSVKVLALLPPYDEPNESVYEPAT